MRGTIVNWQLLKWKLTVEELSGQGGCLEANPGRYTRLDPRRASTLAGHCASFLNL